jgi:hypothetical protein
MATDTSTHQRQEMWSRQTRHCPTCRDERPVEQPPCADHAECPEWICLECGTGIVVGWLTIDAPADRAAVITTAA